MEIKTLEIKEYKLNEHIPQWELFITFTLHINEKDVLCTAFLEYSKNGWKIQIIELQKINKLPKELFKMILNHENIISFKSCIIDKNEENAVRPKISNIKETFRHDNMVVCHYVLTHDDIDEKIRSIIERIDEKWYITCYFKEGLPHYYQIKKNFLGFDDYIFSEIKKDKNMRIRFLF